MATIANPARPSRRRESARRHGRYDETVALEAPRAPYVVVPACSRGIRPVPRERA